MTQRKAFTFLEEVVGTAPMLDPHGEVVEYIEQELISRDFDLATRGDHPEHVSSCEQYTDGTPGGSVRLDPRASTKDKPRRALWNLIHEWGHSFEPPGADRLRSPARERKAWDRGWAEAVAEFPYLNEWVAEFETWRDECVATYGT